jgi:hypothetical protein
VIDKSPVGLLQASFRHYNGVLEELGNAIEKLVALLSQFLIPG